MIPAGVPTSKVGLPFSWLWSWARPEAAVADPGVGGVPKQWSGTAEGKEHYVSGEATKAKGGAAGLPPGKGIGALDPYVPPVQEVKQTTTPALNDGSGMGIMAAVPPQIDAQYPPTGYATPTLTPELLVAAHDPDSTAALSYNFLVYNSAGTKIADSGWIASRTWVVPAGTFVWGQNYMWTAGAKDSAALLSTSQRLNAVSTAVPQPLITSGLAQNDGRGFEPSVGNYTTTATDAVVATVGPSLSIERAYNSQDPRVTQAFGAAWSSVFDARVTEQRDVASVLQTVVATYPGGEEIAYGRNGDGSFASPSGRFATFASVSGGYRLVDKDGTTYLFTSATGVAGRFGLTSLADAQGRTTTLTYDATFKPIKMTSAAGRALTLTWSTPAGATVPHIATVVTDPVTPGDTATALTWTYTYTGDLLTSVCPPTSATACTTYGYGNNSRYPSAVDNAGPRSYWRLGEASGSAAASAVIDNFGTDNGTYANVTLGQPGPLPGSSATASVFNGTTSRVQVPSKLVTNGSYQSISMWFKTTAPNGVLFSYQAGAITSATTTGNYTPALYVGASGKLYGEFWYAGGVNPIASTTPVNDGNWHHAVLSASGNTQSLYLDGTFVGSRAGLIQMVNAASASNMYVGAGFIGGGWPDESHFQQSGNTGYATFFNGSVAEVAFFDKALTATDVTAIQSTGRATAKPLTSIVRPSGNPSATITYDAKTGRVTQVTDSNGGVWKIAAPVVSGSSQVYAGAALAAGPADYYRFAETGTVDAINEVNGNIATYSTVTQGITGGPLGDPVAGFNGTSSYLKLPAQDVPGTAPTSISMWFKMPANNVNGGVLFGYQNGAISDPTGTTSWVPALYVGTDGKLRGTYWVGDLSKIITSAGKVNDGNWHHVALAASTNSTSLYLDGARIGSPVAATRLATTSNQAYIGAGKWTGSWPAHSAALVGYWPGQISEVAYYTSQLSDAQVAAQFGSRDKSAGASVKTYVITDPGNKTITHVYDANTGREVAETDALGNKTQYGYDVGGFLRTITDPNGNVTTSEHDVRGNTVSQTTCQDRSANKCSTVYFTYYPDATTKVLTPDPRNDVMLTTRDGRSSSATDNAYLTSYGYDIKGNRVTITDALGRVTTTAYTDGTTVAAFDGGLAPAGLPMTVTTASGDKQTVVYYRNGDVATVTDPAGKVTRFTYDPLGRVLSEIEVTDTFPSGLTTSYTYDKAGRLATQAEPSTTNRVTGAVHTAVTTSAYNLDGQLTSQIITDTTGGDASRTETTTYNAFGQQDTVTNSAGKISRYAYDLYGNMVRETEEDGGVTTAVHDAEGNLLSSTLVGYTGDPNNPSPAGDLVVTSKVWDPAGRLAKEIDAMGWETVYTYTDNGLTATVSRRDPSTSATFVAEQNTYDGAGNLIRQVTNNGATTQTFIVDAADRTTSATLDPGGLNRTTVNEYSLDDDVVASTLSDSTGVISRSEAIYDRMGRVLANTVHNGALPAMVRWKLTGTAADSSGNSPGSATNITWTPDRGGAASFNGTSSVIASPGPVVDTARSFTIAAWVYPTNNSANRSVWSQESRSESSVNLKVDSLASGTWALSMSDKDDATSTQTYVRSTAPAALNTWQHVAGVFDASAKQMRLYVNGVLVGTQALPAGFVPWTATGPMTLGRVKWHGMLSDWFAGMISDVQAYSKALTATEIAGVQNATLPAAGENVVRNSVLLDQDGLVTASIDELGQTTNYEYDEDGEAVVTISPAVNAETGGGTPVSTRPVTFVGFNTFGEQVEAKDPTGNVTVTTFNADGRPVSMRLPNYTPPGGTAITAQSSATYNDNGQVTSSTDARGKTTTYVYDQLGRLASVTAPNLGVTKYTYDLVGDQLSETDANGATTSATYDFLGRQLTSTQVVRQTGLSHTTTMSYGTGGWLSQTQSPLGVINTMTYNAAGETLTAKDGTNATTTFTYDGAGRQTRTTLADGSYATTTYDLAGRDIAVRTYDPAGTLLATQSTEYDLAGNVTATTDARGTRITFGYDATGMIVSENQPISATDSITTSFGYDIAGRRTRFTDGRGNAYLTTYNVWGLPESQIEPATTRYPALADRTFTSSYDAAGQVTSQKLPGGVSVTNGYDDVGNIITQTGTGAEVTTPGRTFGYDLAGRLTSASAPGGSNTFGYDDRGLLLTTTGPSGAATFSYNADGAMSTRADGAGTTTYGYDTAGRVSTIANSTTGVQQRYGYDALSRIASVTYGGTGNVRGLGYDSRQRLTSDELKTPGGTSIAKITYGYDGNGNLTSKTTAGFAGSSANTYGYDRADRLVLWFDGTTNTNFTYDKSGNRTAVGSKAFTYDQRNQLLTADGVSYVYTPRGTLSQAGTQLTKTDAFGQIVSQDSDLGPQQYQYDALGRMWRSGFVYSGLGNTLVAEGTTKYTRDEDDDLVGVADGASQTYAWTDQHTDVVGQFTATGTALTGSTTYDPLGRIVATNSMLGHLGYQSAWTDFSTGRVNMWNRWYNLLTGQFDTRDAMDLEPIPDSAGANRFAYAEDNPMTETDPIGHWPSCGWCKKAVHAVTHTVSSAYHATTSYVSRAYSYAYSYARSYASYAYSYARSTYHAVKRKVSKAYHAVKRKVSHAYHAAKRWVKHTYHKAKRWVKQKYHAAKRWVKKTYHKAKKWVAHKVHQVKKAVKKAYHRVKQAGKRIVAKTVRVVKQAATKVKDAYHATEKWVKDHKNLIIEAVAIGGAILAGIACTAVTAGAGAVACMVGSAALINLAKDAAQGNIHNWGDAFGSLGTGALQGLAGGAGGAIGGKVAGAVVGKLGKFASTIGGRVLSGGISGGVGDAVTQFATTGHVDMRGVAMSTALGAATGGRGKKTSCTHSFDRRTKVLLASGAVVAIADIKIGDIVLATDPETGKTTAQPVVELHRNLDSDLADVTVQSADGKTTATLHTTAHHPFWNAAAQQWTDAAALQPGDSVRSADAETTQQVVAIKTWTGLQQMHDLTVANVHTYYVMAGDTPVLVHNCGGAPAHVDDVADHILNSGLHNPNKVVVIGRTMDRVKDATRALRAAGVPEAKWYQAWEQKPKGTFDPDLAMRRNTRWIETKKKEGYTIVDIGGDTGRADPIGPFYGMEQAHTSGAGYPTVPMHWPPSPPRSP